MALDRTLLLFSFGLASAIAMNACSSEDDGPSGPTPSTGGVGGVGGAGGGPVGTGGVVTGNGGIGTGTGGVGTGTGGVSGSGGGGSTDACTLNFATLPANAPVSLKDDLMPIFGLSCAGDSCHSAPTKKAGLFLGPKCDFQEGAKWSCVFPAAPNATSGAQPLTPQIIDEVHASLLANAMTVTGPAPVKRVNPGSPETSFIIDKTSDKQNAKGYQCTNTDPKPGQATTCGDVMPLNGDPLCRSGRTGGQKYTALAQWIKNGAPKN